MTTLNPINPKDPLGSRALKVLGFRKKGLRDDCDGFRV